MIAKSRQLSNWKDSQGNLPPFIHDSFTIEHWANVIVSDGVWTSGVFQRTYWRGESEPSNSNYAVFCVQEIISTTTSTKTSTTNDSTQGIFHT